jgi:hypothetical protein
MKTQNLNARILLVGGNEGIEGHSMHVGNRPGILARCNKVRDPVVARLCLVLVKA